MHKINGVFLSLVVFLSLFCLNAVYAGIEEAGTRYFTIYKNSEIVGITRYSLQQREYLGKNSFFLESYTEVMGKDPFSERKQIFSSNFIFDPLQGKPLSYQARIQDKKVETIINLQVNNQIVMDAFVKKNSDSSPDKVSKKFPYKGEYLYDNNFYDHIWMLLTQIKLKKGEKRTIPIFVPQLSKSKMIEVDFNRITTLESQGDIPVREFFLQIDNQKIIAYMSNGELIKINIPAIQVRIEKSSVTEFNGIWICSKTQLINSRKYPVYEAIDLSRGIEISGKLQKQVPLYLDCSSQLYKGISEKEEFKGEIFFHPKKIKEFKPSGNFPLIPEKTFLSQILSENITGETISAMEQIVSAVQKTFRLNPSKEGNKIAEVIANKSGSPFEITSLTGSLLQQFHYPVKMIYGMVRVANGYFVPHYWLEVSMEEKIYRIDPVLGKKIIKSSDFSKDIYVSFIETSEKNPLEWISLRCRLKDLKEIPVSKTPYKKVKNISEKGDFFMFYFSQGNEKIPLGFSEAFLFKKIKFQDETLGNYIKENCLIDYNLMGYNRLLVVKGHRLCDLDGNPREYIADYQDNFQTKNVKNIFKDDQVFSVSKSNEEKSSVNDFNSDTFLVDDNMMSQWEALLSRIPLKIGKYPLTLFSPSGGTVISVEIENQGLDEFQGKKAFKMYIPLLDEYCYIDEKGNFLFAELKTHKIEIQKVEKKVVDNFKKNYHELRKRSDIKFYGK